MSEKTTIAPESTAVRVALWRAMHVQLDSLPHIIEDEIGLKLAAPPEGWRDRPDMEPKGTILFRSSIVARARFIEDLVVESAKHGISQYVILGAGLDTFAQRRSDTASHLRVFEVDSPGPSKWKLHRLKELGFGVPDWLKLVPVDFEAGESWWDQLTAAGFASERPAVVASTGVSMYLTRDAVAATLRQVARLAPGSKFAMTFMLPLELIDAEEQPVQEMTLMYASRSGTPFITFFSPAEIIALAKKCGFKKAEHVSSGDLHKQYFAGRTDGLFLRPSSAEQMLLAST
ncbi:MAG TPA: class I SAM-dependent methyltransferase [Oculatellaceae cyanobacterium]